MTYQPFIEEVEFLLSLLREENLAKLGVIPWAAPVVSFGDPAACNLATLALNPSKHEFMGSGGTPLLGASRRLESLQSLGLNAWDEAQQGDILEIWTACAEYFFRNPYVKWFNKIDKVFAATGASFFNRVGQRACHLDLVPFATEQKWSALLPEQRNKLLELSFPSFARTLTASGIRILVLNGATVVREFGDLLEKGALQRRLQADWSLQNGRVPGFSYEARVSKIGPFSLGRELLVLGFNHNIQGSFGVPRQVVSSITDWVETRAKDSL